MARALAARFERGAHLEGEALWGQIVAGRAMPDPDLEGESERQYELTIRNQCLLARSYAEARITPVMDFVVATRHHLDAYRHYLMGGVLRFVVLAPAPEVVRARDAGRPDKQVAERFMALGDAMRTELSDAGLWLDSSELNVEETVAAVMTRRKDALLP